MSDSVWSHRRQPTRLPHPWDSPGKNTGVGCHFLLQCVKVKSESEVAQSCPTLSNPMDRSLPVSSIHGIFQARVLDWGVIAFSRSTGEGNGKSLQYSCFENPINSIKRQKGIKLKGELPRSVGAQYATGDQWRNNSRKNEETAKAKNNTQLWMWQVMEVKSDAVKSNIA